MNKKTITEKDKLSIFEEIKRELDSLKESLSDEEFRTASDKMIKNWGGAIEKDKSAKLSPEDIFDIADAGAIARADIEGEFGEDEFMPMSSDEYKNLMGDIDEAIDERGLFQVEDAKGNIIKKHALVTPISGVDKKGRVMGFGDDGQGRMQILVTWEWPTDMKFTNPEEMGKDRVYPEEVIIADSNKSDLKEDNFDDEFDSDLELDKFHFDKTSLYKWILDALYQLDVYSKEDIATVIEKAFNRDYEYKPKMNNMEDLNEEKINEDFLNELEDCTEEQEQALEEMRGLGKGVKNSGDRNVKTRDDHHSAPLTNLDESINNLFKGKVTKKQLKDFINEQAIKISKNING